MTPIMVEKNGNFKLALGASGGSKIPTGVMNTLLQRIVYQQTLQDAVFKPRVHDQLLPVGVKFESAFNQEFVAELKDNFGHTIADAGPSWFDANVQGVEIDDQQRRIGACDWRKQELIDLPCETAGF